MENLINKINEFSNFLLNNNVIEEQKLFINGFFIDSPYFTRVNFIRTLRLEDENENKSVIELDISNNEIIKKKYSQINELINLFGLKKDDEDVKNKLNEFLNEFLTYKKEFNL
jgi:hypothetical protein